MATENFFVWFYNFLQGIITLSDKLWTFLFTEVNLNWLRVAVPVVNLIPNFPFVFQVWQLVIGGGFILFVVLSIIKNSVQVA
jgi:hypothetical protein